MGVLFFTRLIFLIFPARISEVLPYNEKKNDLNTSLSQESLWLDKGTELAPR